MSGAGTRNARAGYCSDRTRVPSSSAVENSGGSPNRPSCSIRSKLAYGCRPWSTRSAAPWAETTASEWYGVAARSVANVTTYVARTTPTPKAASAASASSGAMPVDDTNRCRSATAATTASATRSRATVPRARRPRREATRSSTRARREGSPRARVGMSAASAAAYAAKATSGWSASVAATAPTDIAAVAASAPITSARQHTPPDAIHRVDRDGGDLHRDGHAEDDPHHRGRVLRHREEQRELGDDGGREGRADGHASPAHEVGDPQGEEGVRQRGQPVRADDRHGAGVLRPDDERGQRTGRDEVRDRHRPAGHEHEGE